MTALAAALLAFAVHAAPAGSSFSYQGRLEQNGASANGLYDLEFRLFADAAGASEVSIPVVLDNVPVENGVFSVALDFGNLPFDGQARWLHIGVRAGDAVGAYEMLAPLQPVGPAPYAVTALDVAGIDAGKVLSGKLNASRLPSGGNWTITSPLVIQSPAAEVLFGVASDGTLAAGTAWPDSDIESPAAGARLLWAPAYGAFRAGVNTSTAVLGRYSFAVGYDTVASGDYAAAFGLGSSAVNVHSFAAGERSRASGVSSVALGTRANTNARSGSFVFADRSGAAGDDLLAASMNSATWRVANGFRIFTAGNLTTGVTIQSGLVASEWGQNNAVISTSTGAYLSTGGVWTNTSDAARKHAFAPIDGDDVLARVSALPISTWTYNAEPEGVRHLGPTAQDFHAAFGLGSSDKAIATVDADGVALAAAQALERRTARQSREIETLRNENAELRARLERLEALIDAQL